MNELTEAQQVNDSYDHSKESVSIRRQLLTYIVAGVFFLLLIFSITITWLATKQTSSQLVNNAQQVARALAQQSVLALLTESSENAQMALQQVLAFPDVDGAGLVTNEGEIIGWQGHASAELKFQNIDWGSSTSYLITDEDKDRWYIAAAVIFTNNSDEGEEELALFDASEEKLGYAVVSFSKQSLNILNRNIIIAVSFTGIVVLLGLILLVGSAIQRQLVPLEALSDVMVYNHETGEHHRAKPEGSKEIKRMAESFNAMMETLDEQDERLRHHRDQLEAEVKIRTRELVSARDAALTSSRHKSEFLANMTHELRTPIQSIMGYVDLAKEEVENEGVFHVRDDLEKVTRNSERLLGMINCVLDLSKIEAGKMEVNLTSVYLQDLLRNVEEATSPLVPTNNNRFTVKTLAENKLLRIDGEKVLQVLINLVSNACKFTQNGDITLETTEEHEHIVFKVIDTGIGIPEEHLAQIFQEFKQIDAGENRQFSGTGLGLAISKQFCELMNAQIFVESQVRKGTTFTVRLPI